MSGNGHDKERKNIIASEAMRDTDTEKHVPRVPEVIDANTGLPDPTPKPKRNRLLSSVKGCRLKIAETIRKVEDGEMEPALGAKLVWMLRELIQSLGDEQIEARITALENGGEFPAPPKRQH